MLVPTVSRSLDVAVGNMGVLRHHARLHMPEHSADVWATEHHGLGPFSPWYASSHAGVHP